MLQGYGIHGYKTLGFRLQGTGIQNTDYNDTECRDTEHTLIQRKTGCIKNEEMRGHDKDRIEYLVFIKTVLFHFYSVASC